MANPYKKAEQVQKKAPGSRQEQKPQEEQTTPVVEVKQQETVTPQPAEPAVVETPVKEDLLAGMLEKKPRGKSYGFYLDDEVVAALDKLARQNKSNKSKVLNTLLRNMLLK
jgi:hypothetical protein